MNSTPRSVSRTAVAPPTLVALICSAQSGGSSGASTRPRSRTVTSIRPLANSRVVFAAVEAGAHGFGLALALGQRRAALGGRHDEDHLLQHVFGGARLGAALFEHPLHQLLLARAAAALLGAVARAERLVPGHLGADEFLEMLLGDAGLRQDAVELLELHLVGRGKALHRRRRPGRR